MGLPMTIKDQNDIEQYTTFVWSAVELLAV